MPAYPGRAGRAGVGIVGGRAHAEIAYQIARLGRLIDDIGDRAPDQDDLTDLRGTLYGLHAILRLHTVQEDETYLSLGDSTDVLTP